MSILSTFYVEIFCTNVVLAAWSLALNELSYKKCARKTLMKLTASVENIRKGKKWFVPRKDLLHKINILNQRALDILEEA